MPKRWRALFLAWRGPSFSGLRPSSSFSCFIVLIIYLAEENWNPFGVCPPLSPCSLPTTTSLKKSWRKRPLFPKCVNTQTSRASGAGDRMEFRDMAGMILKRRIHSLLSREPAAGCSVAFLTSPQLPACHRPLWPPFILHPLKFSLRSLLTLP